MINKFLKDFIFKIESKKSNLLAKIKKNEIEEEKQSINQEIEKLKTGLVNVNILKVSNLSEFKIDGKQENYIMIDLIDIKKWDTINIGEEGSLRKFMGANITNINDIDKKINSFFKNSYADPNKLNSLKQKWEQIKKNNFLPQFIDIFQNIKTEILSKILNKFEISDNIEDLNNKLVNLEIILKNINNSYTYSDNNNHKIIFKFISDGLQARKNEIDTAKLQIIDNEKKIKILNIQEKYLANQYKLALDYLKQLFEANLEIEFGSVSQFSEQSMSMEQKLEIHGRLNKNNISLEIRKNREEILFKKDIINWVGTHEIAHLVYEKIPENIKNKILTNGLQNREIIGIDKELLNNIFKEIIIDGIGSQMLMKYGTTNIHSHQYDHIINDITRSLSALINLIKRRKEGEEGKEGEEKDNLKIILLLFRLLIPIKYFIIEMGRLDCYQYVYDDLKHLENKIFSMISKYNNGNDNINEEIYNQIINEFKNAFEIGIIMQIN